MDDYALYRKSIMILMFSDRTRLSKEKYQDSLRCANKFGAEAFKHHVFLSMRGFVSIIKHLKQHGKSKEVKVLKMFLTEWVKV